MNKEEMPEDSMTQQTDTQTIDLSVVIPVHNEEENVRLLIPQLQKVLERLNKPYEILFVDDGSSDNTGSVITKAPAMVSPTSDPLRRLNLNSPSASGNSRSSLT